VEESVRIPSSGKEIACKIAAKKIEISYLDTPLTHTHLVIFACKIAAKNIGRKAKNGLHIPHLPLNLTLLALREYNKTLSKQGFLVVPCFNFSL
jgi:hypothetical protein